MSVVEHTVSPANWIKTLVEQFADCIIPLGPMPKLGYLIHEPDSTYNTEKCWLIGIYPLPVSLLGKPYNGRTAVSTYDLDLFKFMSCFNEVNSMQVCGVRNQGGFSDSARTEIAGLFINYPVHVLLFTAPPPDEGACAEVTVEDMLQQSVPIADLYEEEDAA